MGILKGSELYVEKYAPLKDPIELIVKGYHVSLGSRRRISSWWIRSPAAEEHCDVDPAVTIALAGNPNSGKTTIFNNLTGTRQKVGNWPGVTVEKKEGHIHHEGRPLTIIDLAGNLQPHPLFHRRDRGAGLHSG
jgi:hypothetical protein